MAVQPFPGETKEAFLARGGAAGYMEDIYGVAITGAAIADRDEAALSAVPGMVAAAVGGGTLGAIAGVATGALLGYLGANGNGTTAVAGPAGGKGFNQVVGGVYVNGTPLGIGTPEPPHAMVARQWKTKAFSFTVGEYWVYFYKLIDGRIMCFNAARAEWKIWRPKKPIVLYRGKITLSQAVKTQRMLDRLWRGVAKKTKALKLA